MRLLFLRSVDSSHPSLFVSVRALELVSVQFLSVVLM